MAGTETIFEDTTALRRIFDWHFTPELRRAHVLSCDLTLGDVTTTATATTLLYWDTTTTSAKIRGYYYHNYYSSGILLHYDASFHRPPTQLAQDGDHCEFTAARVPIHSDASTPFCGSGSQSCRFLGGHLNFLDEPCGVRPKKASKSRV